MRWRIAVRLSSLDLGLPVMRQQLIWLTLPVWVLGCQQKADADAVAASCGGTCPAGTWRDEQRSSRSQSTAYADFVEGDCSWSCVAVTSCPSDTVPVITEDCFTCARATPDGSLSGGACDDATWASGRDDSPDGTQPVAEVGGSVPEDDSAPRFRNLTLVTSWELSFIPRAVAANEDGVWVADWNTESIFLLDRGTGAAIDRLSVPGLQPTDLTISGDHLWILSDGIEVWSLSSRSAEYTLDSLSYAGVAALDDEVLHVASTTLIRHDGSTGAVLDNSALQRSAAAPVAATWDRLLSIEWDTDDPRSDWVVQVHDITASSPHPTEEPMELAIGAGRPTAFAARGTTLYAAGEGGTGDEHRLYVVEFD